MTGSGNMPFPGRVTLGGPWQSVDDPCWSLTALTGDTQGSKHPVTTVTREPAPVLMFRDAVARIRVKSWAGED